MAGGQPAFGGTGATVQSQYMVRTMKCYPVHESEMEMLSTLTTEATIFFSLASLSIGYALSIWINGSFVVTLTDKAKNALAVAPIALTAGLILLGIAIYQVVRREGLWGRIKKEAVVVESTAISQSTAVMGPVAGPSSSSAGPSLSSVVGPSPPSPASP
jgi:hypothetical protein